MKVLLAAPDTYRFEARLVARALDGVGADPELCRPGTEGALQLRVGEELVLLPEPAAAAVLSLPEPRDGLVTPPGRPGRLVDLGPGSHVAMAGRLRTAMLAVHRRDLRALEVERPEEARAMLEEGRVEAWIAPIRHARAVDLASWTSEVFEPTSWATAAGRGVVVLDASDAPEAVRALVRLIDDKAGRAAFAAELEMLAALGAGPDAPLGVMARAQGSQLRLRALVPSEDGRRLVRAELSGPLSNPSGAGRRVAELLRARGALDVLGVAS